MCATNSLLCFIVLLLIAGTVLWHLHISSKQKVGHYSGQYKLSSAERVMEALPIILIGSIAVVIFCFEGFGNQIEALSLQLTGSKEALPSLLFFISLGSWAIASYYLTRTMIRRWLKPIPFLGQSVLLRPGSFEVFKVDRTTKSERGVCPLGIVEILNPFTNAENG